MLAFCLLGLLCSQGRATGQTPKNILFLFSSQDQQRRDLNSFVKVLQVKVPQHLVIHSSYVDYERMGNTAYRDRLAETFHEAYKDVKMDVAIVSAIEALQFVLQYRDRILPGVPIVFYALSASELKVLRRPLPPDVTGRTASIGLRQTIDLALRLQPDAQSLAIVTAQPDFWWRAAREEVDHHNNRVKAIDIFGPPGTEVLDKIAALPPHTIILFQLAALSAKDAEIKPYDVLAAAARHRPTFCAWKDSFINGCIGGAYIDEERYIQDTAAITARVLTGERPEAIPLVDNASFSTQVDWNELHRWNIPESNLPPGTVILNRPPSLWKSYRSSILIAIAMILAQAILIAALLWQRARKREAEAVLRESEKRFRVMADTTPSLVWMCDSHGKITYLNKQRIEFTDSKPGIRPYNSWMTSIHQDDLKNVQNTLANALRSQQAFSQEYRLRRRDGIYRWMHEVALPRISGDKTFLGFIGSAVDATEYKLARQSLEKLGGQLIEAQERDRNRIARELHDDICQRLALLSLKIQGAHEDAVIQAPDTAKNLDEVGKLCDKIASDVQGLSHRLHSSILEALGITTALEGLCKELSRQHDVHIQIRVRDVPKHLPKDISICLFRIAQEALHNAVKYSGVKEFAVDLVASWDEIQLTILDHGIGFDPEHVKDLGGLGLVSMQERAHLLHGTFSIQSKPGEGTRVLVIVSRSTNGDRDDTETLSERDDEHLVNNAT